MLGGGGVEEIRNILEWVGGALGGTTRSEFVGLAAAVFTLAATLFFVFPAACLVVAVDLVSGFLGPAFCLVAVTLGCLGTSVTG